MTFTASEVASLATRLFWWEIAEYCFTGLVTLACAGEFAASFTNWFTGGEEKRKKLLEKRSTLLLVVALSLELVCLVKTNNLSGQLIGSISDLAGDATNKAQKALDDSDAAIKKSDTAIVKAGSAQTTSQGAIDKSGRAETSAYNALGLARGARQEADTFEKRLWSAEHKADEAESHVNDALERAWSASIELTRLRSPRLLTNVPELVERLKTFSGTEFTFSFVFADDESLQFLKLLDKTLEECGWKRVKRSGSRLGVPAIKITGTDDTVDMDVATGVHIAVESTDTVAQLNELPADKRPVAVRTAVALNDLIFSHTWPPEGPADKNVVGIDSGSSPVLKISVGKKP